MLKFWPIVMAFITLILTIHNYARRKCIRNIESSYTLTQIPSLRGCDPVQDQTDPERGHDSRNILVNPDLNIQSEELKVKNFELDFGLEIKGSGHCW